MTKEEFKARVSDVNDKGLTMEGFVEKKFDELQEELDAIKKRIAELEKKGGETSHPYPAFPDNFPCDGTTCTNPLQDCINCPRKAGHGWNTIATTKISEDSINNTTESKQYNKSTLAELEIDDRICPLTIIDDRYDGTYSGGAYLAFNLECFEIPDEVYGDDVSCMCYWEDADKTKIGLGRNPQEAYEDLKTKLKEKKL